MGFNTNAMASKCFICCKGCEERKEMCHDSCQKYLSAKETYEKLIRKVNMSKNIYTRREELKLGKRRGQN